MKKLLFLLMASFLVLAACGNEEESKLDDKKETKASDKESKKKDNEKETDKKEDKTDDKSNEDVAAQDEDTQSQEQQTTEQPVQSQEQMNTQEEQPVQQEGVYNPAREQVINEGIDMDNPTDAEIERMRELSKDSPHGLQTEPSQGKLPADLNENAEDNRNGYGEDTLSPGYESQAQENQAYEDYKRGKEAQAAAGPSAVPGAGLMDLDE
uniref:hypothetical protein n=1 Tax=Staphylococcus equorum TaxID=246432 RepID=UPI000A81825E|nr:hypothetical protein [Staphylococcus equorum]